MELRENLDKILILKNELDRLRPISKEIEQKIMQKFRLDWNYHSSNIEGNSLTYGETRALLLFGHTAQAKPLKDHLEMSGHDQAIKYIEEVVKNKRPLNENFIRELHELILKEPYYVDAVTPDGKSVKKWITVGKYKSTNNHVITKTGEMFYFASAEETPAKMNDLISWYSNEIKNVQINPIFFAAEFHYRFIRIHPFDDGNGRIARLLMNFILMLEGYPPAVVKTNEKGKYYQALEQADAGNIEYFVQYICRLVIYSLELMLMAINGEPIEEPDDWEKKLSILKQNLGENANSEIVIERNLNEIKKVLENSIKPVLLNLDINLKKFNPILKEGSTEIRAYIGFYGESFIQAFEELMNEKFQKNLSNLNKYPITFYSISKGIINLKGDSTIFNKFEVIFHKNLYEISVEGFTKVIWKRYNDFLTDNEIQIIVSQFCNYQYEKIEKALNEEKLNKL